LKIIKLFKINYLSLIEGVIPSLDWRLPTYNYLNADGYLIEIDNTELYWANIHEE
jgi:hypothetical protein